MSSARTITTSNGKTYNVAYAWAPLFDGSCGIGLLDPRPIAQITGEFDGLTHIHYSDPPTGEYDFDGYTRLSKISASDQPGLVYIRLIKEE